MIVLAHAAHWLEPVLFTVPAAVVVAAIVRTRRDSTNPSHEETTR